VWAIPAYVLAEVAVTRFRLYRHGIEEALGLASAGLMIAGVGLWLSTAHPGDRQLFASIAVLTALVLLALFIRFGSLYAGIGAIAAAAVVPFTFDLSFLSTRFLDAALLAVLAAIVGRLDATAAYEFQADRYQYLEGVLLLGVYGMLNLHLYPASIAGDPLFRIGLLQQTSRYGYWATYVICWAIAAAIATIAVKRRRRTMLHAGMAMLALSFVTNKPYFGLARKSWDPILFGL